MQFLNVNQLFALLIKVMVINCSYWAGMVNY